MSQNSPPQPTPQWLRDLKQGRAQGERPAARENAEPAGMADGNSSEESSPRRGIGDRLSTEVPALERRAIDLTDDPAEAAKLVQECCLQALASDGAGDSGSQESGPESDDWLGAILEAAWRERQSRSFGEVQETSPLSVEDPQPSSSRPGLCHIARVLRRLTKDQQDLLTAIASSEIPSAGRAGTASNRAITAFHRVPRSGAMVQSEHQMPLPRLILLALLIPFLDRNDQMALEQEDTTTVLPRCVIKLCKELKTPAPTLQGSDQAGALLVLLLIREIIPEQLTFAVPPGLLDATFEQDDVVIGLFDLAASTLATDGPGSGSAEPRTPNEIIDRTSASVTARPSSGSKPDRSKPDQSAADSSTAGPDPVGPATSSQKALTPPGGLQQAIGIPSSHPAHLSLAYPLAASVQPAVRVMRPPRARGLRFGIMARTNAQ